MKDQMQPFFLLESKDLEKKLEAVVQKQFAEFSKNFTPKKPTIWITRNEASELLGVSLVTIHNWTKEGVINAYKIGTRVRFKRSEIENILLNSNKRASK